MRQAVEGKSISGVTVAQIIAHLTGIDAPATWSGCCLCCQIGGSFVRGDAPLSDPVARAIHSSEVSTIRSRSALVSTLSGTLAPVPRIPYGLLSTYFTYFYFGTIISAMVAAILFSTVSRATRMALRIAFALELPWATGTTPFTKSGAHRIPYSPSAF